MSHQQSSGTVEELSFSTYGFISRCPEQVYEAIADPRQLSRYFTTGGAQGRMESGATLTWDFADFPGAFPVSVVEAVPSRRLVLEWAGTDTVTDSGTTTITFIFEAADDYTRTRVTITGQGWRPTPNGSLDAFGNCAGWTDMLAALKVWLEHGVNLRADFYK
ncbi:hypothetical protein CFAEC_03145 [Corynebacterium faecale]|uniref:SRPBCC domain-containing protein n=1 Tax=Corynebacterium faecale TaxID=1758466 RepID=UPI0025B62922|nr:SRPBCC domain-containing protein [Corynebacterium faecale]WJY91484.1 hypothetical protein CFAEC_03145 [Corynebacterium faecale]